MIMVSTRRGTTVFVISQSELRSPQSTGTYVRAFCHIHGSDHQRSLSIHKKSGWGHCFNAACMVTVLVADWNPAAAAMLTHTGEGSYAPPARLSFASPQPEEDALPLARQPMLLFPVQETPAWQRDELAALTSTLTNVSASPLRSKRAQLYLRERDIPLEIALATGVRYLPCASLRSAARRNRQYLSRWSERIIFPLHSPTGRGYIGRALQGWRPGMDENAHKALLESGEKPRRWIKSNPAGWFCAPFEQLAEALILVEGAFDRLTLLAAGFHASEVVALAGTAARVDWLPPQVKTIILALDGDEGGHEAAARLAECYRRAGLSVHTCLPRQDQWGKDWNERWHRRGIESILPLIDTHLNLSRLIPA